MSWRVLTVTLLVALGAAAWGGLQLGDWLVQHAPQAAPAPANQDGSTQPVLDADGKPYVAQPPQPRVDGTLGVPEKTAATDWTINAQSLFDSATAPTVQLSRSAVSPRQAAQIAANSRSSLPGGDTDNVFDSAGDNAVMGGSRFGGAMVQAPQAPAPAANTGGSGGGSWLSSLRGELAQCANTGFFERPTCSWNARNRYCGPNQAWGKVSECPQRP